MKKLIIILSTSLSLAIVICLFMLSPSNVDSMSTASADPIATPVYIDIEDIQQIKYNESLYCLALNVYHEARSDSKLGQEAVALVTMNRKDSERYPNTVCGVVYQSKTDSNGNPIRNKCQFSWFCDGKSDETKNTDKWIEALEVAAYVYNGYGDIRDITDGAIMYHADYVRPYWKNDYTRTTRIDSHIFYK
jgi:N-acetylmuramoyl-L-alanine amidase